MAAVETVLTSLNGNFKNVYGSQIYDLIPQTDILYRKDRIKFVDKKGREGIQLNQPVLVSMPSSATWGLNGPTLLPAIAMQLANATITGSAITMRDVLSYDAAARAVGSDAAFEATVGLVIKTLYKAHAKFAEIDLLYGSGAITYGNSISLASSVSGTGGITSVTQVGSSSVYQATVTLTYATWSPAMFSGFENAQLVGYASTGGLVNTSTTYFTVAAVGVVPASSSVGGTLLLYGTQTDMNALYTAIYTNSYTVEFYWASAYGNNMVGLKGILANTGTLFGISASSYSLWQSNSFSASSTQLTFAKVQQATALSVSRGLDENTICLVSPVTFADLVNEQAGARRYDSSYKSSKEETGTEALTFWGPAGKIEVIPHMFVHQGEGFIFPPEELMKVGPLDHISPTLPGIDGELFFQSPLAASYEIRLFSDFGLLNAQPAKSTLITSIVNSVSA